MCDCDEDYREQINIQRFITKIAELSEQLGMWKEKYQQLQIFQNEQEQLRQGRENAKALQISLGEKNDIQQTPSTD